jgi:hypothetical protein
MAESSIQPEINAPAKTDKLAIQFVEPPAAVTQQPTATSATSATIATTATSATPSTIIWTPRFIVLFALTLVIALSADSLLTQAVLGRLFRETWVSLAHLLPAFVCLLAIIIVTRSWWIRLGAIFASIWVLFISLNHVLPFFRLDPGSSIPSLLNAIICSALFGAYICLSIDRTPFTRWDIWFFRIVLIVSICAAPLIYIATPADSLTLNTIESDLAALGLVLALLVWWARPSCWKMQPGLALLFGMLPAIELLLSLHGIGTGATNLYLTQVSLLCFLLGTMRLLKGQLR